MKINSWGTYNDTNWESHVWAWSETASGEKFYPVYEDANTKEVSMVTREMSIILV